VENEINKEEENINNMENNLNNNNNNYNNNNNNKKKKNLEENIKKLEDLSNKIEQTINELKFMFENTNKNKEDLKTKIQVMFSKVRNEINKREDELLLEVDKTFDELFCDEKIIKKSQEFPHKIKMYLEKGKKINDEWKDKEKLSLIINDCINIENSINDINNINDIIQNYTENKNFEFKLKLNEDKLRYYFDLFKNILYEGDLKSKNDEEGGKKEENVIEEKEGKNEIKDENKKEEKD